MSLFYNILVLKKSLLYSHYSSKQFHHQDHLISPEFDNAIFFPFQLLIQYCIFLVSSVYLIFSADAIPFNTTQLCSYTNCNIVLTDNLYINRPIQESKGFFQNATVYSTYIFYFIIQYMFSIRLNILLYKVIRISVTKRRRKRQCRLE